MIRFFLLHYHQSQDTVRCTCILKNLFKSSPFKFQNYMKLFGGFLCKKDIWLCSNAKFCGWSDGQWDYWNEHFRVRWGAFFCGIQMWTSISLTFLNLMIFRMNSDSLVLGVGALSWLTGDPKYESAALCALRRLWGMWSSLNLLGTTLGVSTGEWIVYSSGIGAGRFRQGFEVFNALHYKYI